MLAQCHHECVGAFLAHKGLMETQVLTTPRKAAVLLTPPLGLKAALNKHPRKGMRVKRGWGDWVLQHGADEELEAHGGFTEFGFKYLIFFLSRW